MTFAPHFQPPPQPLPLPKRISGELGLWAMWAALAMLTAAVAIAAIHAMHRNSDWVMAGLLIPFDALFIAIHLRWRRDRALAYDGFLKTVVILFFVGAFTGRSRPAMVEDVSPIAELIVPFILLTGPVTFIAAILRRLGR